MIEPYFRLQMSRALKAFFASQNTEQTLVVWPVTMTLKISARQIKNKVYASVDITSFEVLPRRAAYDYLAFVLDILEKQAKQYGFIIVYLVKMKTTRSGYVKDTGQNYYATLT